jgi:hypothetical protein
MQYQTIVTATRYAVHVLQKSCWCMLLVGALHLMNQDLFPFSMQALRLDDLWFVVDPFEDDVQCVGCTKATVDSCKSDI